MSQETKKMLAIIDKQHKEAYEQIQKEKKQRKLAMNITLIILMTIHALMILYFIFIF